MVVINTMEWLILGAICLLVLICICLIVFFSRRNRNEHIVKSRITRRASDDPEAPVAFLETHYRKKDNDLMDTLKTLNNKADIAIEKNKKMLEDSKKLNIKLEEDKKKLENII